MNVSDTCSICKKSSDQMLMLSCVHDPCINCAANSFAQQVHIKGQSPDIFLCQVCGQQTNLDSSTTAQLSNLAKSYVKMPTSIKVTTTHHNSKSRAFGSSTSPATKKKQTFNATANKKTAYFCKQHSQQQISYYCFDCHQNICPQCAIHGKHKDHNVKLIKKALGEVKGDYLQIMNLISGSQASMSKYKDNFLKHIKQTNQKSNRDKAVVSKQFDIIRNSLALKQKQLLKSIQDLNKKNIQVLTNFLEIINIHYQEVSKVKKSIELILRKDQVLIFQQYKKISQLDEKVKQTKKKSDQISGQMVFLNIQYLQQQMKSINQNIVKIKDNLKKQEVRSPSGVADYRYSERQ